MFGVSRTITRGYLVIWYLLIWTSSLTNLDISNGRHCSMFGVSRTITRGYLVIWYLLIWTSSLTNLDISNGKALFVVRRFPNYLCEVIW